MALTRVPRKGVLWTSTCRHAHVWDFLQTDALSPLDCCISEYGQPWSHILRVWARGTVSSEWAVSAPGFSAGEMLLTFL